MASFWNERMECTGLSRAPQAAHCPPLPWSLPWAVWYTWAAEWQLKEQPGEGKALVVIRTRQVLHPQRALGAHECISCVCIKMLLILPQDCSWILEMLYMP